VRRRNREINIFNLSMLDVIAGAMAAFLIIMIVLMPYYRKEHVDYQAMLAQLRAQVAAAEAAAADADAALSAARAEAESARAAERAARSEANALRPRDLDLVIVLDSTGSMGEEIASLRADAKGLVRILSELSKTLRVGVVAYRDRGSDEAYLTQVAPLSPMTGGGLVELERFLDALGADGGGDAPEAVDAGLAQAMAQPWNLAADGIIVVIGDAPAHPDTIDDTFRLAREFAAQSTRFRVSTIAQGPAEPYFRVLAEQGNGVFISGATALLENIIVSIFKREGE